MSKGGIVQSGLAQAMSMFGVDTDSIKNEALAAIQPLVKALQESNERQQRIEKKLDSMAAVVATLVQKHNIEVGMLTNQIRMMQAANIDLTDLPPQDCEEPNLGATTLRRK
jgi:hypothetical protein